MQNAYSQGDFQHTRQLLERARRQGRTGASERGRVALATGREEAESASQAFEAQTRPAETIPIPPSEPDDASVFEVSDVRIYNDLQLLMTVVTRLLHMNDSQNSSRTPQSNASHARQEIE
eukprot:5599206-Amphidinium_carterae.2